MKVATSLFAIYLIDSSVSMIIGKTYQHAIPTSRLGTSHGSLVAFNEAVNADTDSKQKQNNQQAPTEFSLVVILSRNAQSRDGDGRSYPSADIVSNTTSNSNSNISILLGKKLRGFGEGFYNCFGGKLEKARGEHDHPAKGAVREINEETGIDIPLPVMEDGFVGEINFTFEDSDVNRAMRVHLYCVFVEISRDQLAEPTSQTNNGNEAKKNQKGAHTPVMLHPNQIRGCDEIEPKWFHNIHDIPLDQMFADDSLWLRMLLTHYDSSEVSKLKFDAWFHFHPGGTKTNSIMHHCTKINAPKLTMQK